MLTFNMAIQTKKTILILVGITDSVPVALQAKALSQNLFYKSSPKIALRTKALQPNAIQPLSKSHPPKALRPIALQIKSFW